MAEELQPVRVVRVDLTFGHMVGLFIQMSFAAAIAATITSVIWIGIGVGFMIVVTLLTSLIGAAVM